MENIENTDTPENADNVLDFTEQELEISLSSDGFVFHPDTEEDAGRELRSLVKNYFEELNQKLFRQLSSGFKSYGRAAS